MIYKQLPFSLLLVCAASGVFLGKTKPKTLRKQIPDETQASFSQKIRIRNRNQPEARESVSRKEICRHVRKRFYFRSAKSLLFTAILKWFAKVLFLVAYCIQRPKCTMDDMTEFKQRTFTTIQNIFQTFSAGFSSI